VNHIDCASQIVPFPLVVKGTVKGKRLATPDVRKVKLRPRPFGTHAFDGDAEGDGAGDDGQVQVVLMFTKQTNPAGC